LDFKTVLMKKGQTKDVILANYGVVADSPSFKTFISFLQENYNLDRKSFELIQKLASEFCTENEGE
jgi:hypothetical protein